MNDARKHSPTSRPRTALAPVLAGVTVASGLANVLLTLPRLFHGARPLLTGMPLEVTRGSRILSVLAGLFLLLLARGLGRRKHAAWQLAVALFAVSALLHPLKGRTEEAALLSLGMVVVLLLARREFWVKSDPLTLAGGWAMMGLSVLVAYLYTAAGYYLLRRHFAQVTDVGSALWAALGLLTTLQPGGAFPLNREAAAFAWTACAIEVSGLFAGLFLMLAPFIDRRRIQESERPLVEPLLRRLGRSSTAYFALEGDNRYFFPRRVPGVVPYTYRAGVALVAGEPLAEPADLEGACLEFSEFCEEHGWAPAFYQMGPESRELLGARGFSAIKVGEEAFFDLRSYSLGGSRRARLRHGVSRAHREGLSVVEHVPGVAGSEPRQARMEALSAQWLRSHGGREMGYLLGGLSLRAPRDRRYFVAEHGERVVAMVTFVPVYARHGMVLDLMRRATDAPPGTMELLIHTALETFARERLSVCSLALSPLANVSSESETGFGGAHRVLGLAFDRLNRLYNFRTLYAFKHGLGPDVWDPRYLVFRNPGSLPSIALALIQVHEPRSLIARWFQRPGRAPKPREPRPLEPLGGPSAVAG